MGIIKALKLGFDYQRYDDIIVSLIVKSQLKRLDNSHLFCSP